MGKVASMLADGIILTSDNPRFEDPLKIIEDIEKVLIRQSLIKLFLTEDLL